MPTGYYLRKKGIRPWLIKANLGSKHSEEHKRKIGDSVRGEKNGNFGKKFSPEILNKLSVARKGRPSWNKGLKGWRAEGSGASKGNIPWNKGIGNRTEHQRIRDSIEYDLWHSSVLARDNWTCCDCKIRGGKLHTHHIKPFSKFPELRLALDNGITLCKKCHLKRHTKYLK